LEHIISTNESAVIQKRYIHDNFVYVQEVIKDLHKRKILAPFLKLDILKAFDTVSWPYLLQIMWHLGFGQRCRNWISSIWKTTSSTFLLNGEPGKRILHCRSVRQGDPLPPMLFLLAIEHLHKLVAKAQEMEMLDILSKRCDTFIISLYDDDATLFIGPSKKDFKIVSEILNIFSAASGLKTNLHKTEIHPINCNSSAMSHLQASGMVLASFACKYLGLPLHYTSNWACATRNYEILNLENMDEDGCYVELYFYDKLSSLRPRDMSDPSVKHVQGTRFGSIMHETCMILHGNLLPHPTNCSRHLTNRSRHSTNCCMHMTNYCMHSASGSRHRSEFTGFIDLVQLG
jgi:hypothetical protein